MQPTPSRRSRARSSSRPPQRMNPTSCTRSTTWAARASRRGATSRAASRWYALPAPRWPPTHGKQSSFARSTPGSPRRTDRRFVTTSHEAARGLRGWSAGTIVTATVEGGSNEDPVAPAGAAPLRGTQTNDPSPSARVEEPDAGLPRVAPFLDPDRYRILGEHGRGGLGRVLRAHDRELGRDVAIKELISGGGVAELRFLREALITARLEHPGIVPVHEAGRWPDGTPFYAMKLVSGRPLRDLIAERPTVDQRIGLLHHVIAVADAIAYAHGRDIIHRDLKPSNVI